MWKKIKLIRHLEYVADSHRELYAERNVLVKFLGTKRREGGRQSRLHRDLKKCNNLYPKYLLALLQFARTLIIVDVGPIEWAESIDSRGEEVAALQLL